MSEIGDHVVVVMHSTMMRLQPSCAVRSLTGSIGQQRDGFSVETIAGVDRCEWMWLHVNEHADMISRRLETECWVGNNYSHPPNSAPPPALKRKGKRGIQHRKITFFSRDLPPRRICPSLCWHLTTAPKIDDSTNTRAFVEYPMIELRAVCEMCIILG